jgi:hypothetical protein
MRQSLLNDFDVCHLRAAYGLDPSLPRSTSEARIRGTLYHAPLAEYYRHGLRPSPAAVASIVTTELAKVNDEYEGRLRWDLSSPEHAVQLATRLALVYLDSHSWPLADYDVLAVEHSFDIAWFGEHRCIGTIDLALREKATGWVYYVDHKTARRPWRKGKEGPRMTNQAGWYIAAGEALGVDPGASRFFFDVMTYDADFCRIESLSTAAERSALMLKAQAVVRLVEADGPFLPNTQTYLCSSDFCDHWDYCPWGAHFHAPGQAPIYYPPQPRH